MRGMYTYIQICRTYENVHRNPWNTRNTWRFSFGPGTKLLFTFLSWRFFDMRRERERQTHTHTHTQFLSILTFPSESTTWGTPPQTTGLASASSENWFASFKPKSQLCFFQIPKSSAHRFRAWRHLRPISYLGFLLWHLWLSHPPHVRVNTCTQCVHLTNPWTKPKGSQPI